MNNRYIHVYQTSIKDKGFDGTLQVICDPSEVLDSTHIDAGLFRIP